MKTIGVYSGTFDPFTLGHMWIVEEAEQIFDEIHVVVADHPKKNPFYNLLTRINMVELASNHLPNVQCCGLQQENIIEYVRSIKRDQDTQVIIIRGIRNAGDLEYEKKILAWQRKLAANISWLKYTFFIPPKHLNGISSTEVKELAATGRWDEVKELVSDTVYYVMKKHPAPVVDAKKLQLEKDLQYLSKDRKVNVIYFGKMKDHFTAAVNNGFFQYAEIVNSEQVRNMLDPFPVNLVVSDKFHLKKIDINCVKPTGTRYLPSSQSLGPIIVEANEVLGDNSHLGKLGPAIIIEGKHRWLDARDRGEMSIMAWVGEKALKYIKEINDI